MKHPLLHKNAMKNCLKLILHDLNRYKSIITALCVSLILFDRLFHCSCPIALITGFPCPGCGITRALMLLVTFHFREAFQMHPMIYIWVPTILVLLFYRYCLHRSFRFVNQLLIIVGLLTIAVYVFRMLLLYPDTAPMTYYSSNLLHQLMHWFSQLSFS